MAVMSCDPWDNYRTAALVRSVRAFHRGYRGRTGSAKQTRRMHLVREDGKYPGRQGLCGIHGWDVTHSETVFFTRAPEILPAGFSWCPRCIDRLVKSS